MNIQELQQIKQRFGIIGNCDALNHAIHLALTISATDLSVLITGESGVGKEHFPKIIHAYSARKHGPYMAINCGAIPEGTIDAELFGHEKGAFTGAISERKGYFEAADGGTLFLDEVGELPLSTQARLLRVLESGEFIRVGSSKIQKTNVRVVAATNVNILEAIQRGKFRADLYYRLNTVPIIVPPLRDRQDDIALLFRKFAADCAEAYHMPTVHLTEDARAALSHYYWHGNIRQLKNITEQISVLEHNREIDAHTLSKYLPNEEIGHQPMLVNDNSHHLADSDVQLLFQLVGKLHDEVADLRQQLRHLQTGVPTTIPAHTNALAAPAQTVVTHPHDEQNWIEVTGEVLNETDETPALQLSMRDIERKQIEEALQRHRGNRSKAAKELGLSERTIYRKIKDYELNF